MAYYTLLTRYNGQWAPQFGDHSREVVEQERRDILYSADPAEYITARDMVIIKTATAHQWRINQEVMRRNAEEWKERGA